MVDKRLSELHQHLVIFEQCSETKRWVTHTVYDSGHLLNPNVTLAAYRGAIRWIASPHNGSEYYKHPTASLCGVPELRHSGRHLQRDDHRRRVAPRGGGHPRIARVFCEKRNSRWCLKFFQNAAVAVADARASSNQPALCCWRIVMLSVPAGLLKNALRSRTMNGTVRRFVESCDCLRAAVPNDA